MTSLLIKGGLVITPTEERMTDVLVEADKISSLSPGQIPEGAVEVDASACYVTPGLFDIQVNGGPECDFWGELSKDKVAKFSKRLISTGTTSILPTLITGAIDRLKKNRDFLKPDLGLARAQTAKANSLVRMPGIHFEGPCLSAKKPGVHPPEHLKPLELSVLKEIIDNNCRLITLAPELDPSGACLKFLQEHSVVCALGHSNATFEEAQTAFARGCSAMTHTFNALPALHHREPGAVAAAFLDDDVTCCVIPDGLHVVPPMVELVVRVKKAAKTVLVTDMAAIGTSQGGLVGSSLMLDEGIRNMVKWKACTFAEAIRMASYNPAKLFKMEDQIGQIKPGAYADLVLWDRETLEIKQVIFNGSLFKSDLAAMLRDIVNSNRSS
jgi:N-acetylglucosamine-6-phosphate deacetylase